MATLHDANYVTLMKWGGNCVPTGQDPLRGCGRHLFDRGLGNQLGTLLAPTGRPHVQPYGVTITTVGWVTSRGALLAPAGWPHAQPYEVTVPYIWIYFIWMHGPHLWMYGSLQEVHRGRRHQP